MTPTHIPHAGNFRELTVAACVDTKDGIRAATEADKDADDSLHSNIFWSIYGKRAEDDIECIGDFISEEAALSVARDLQCEDLRPHLGGFIAYTTDGIPVFYAYKESDDFTSRRSSLWVALGIPRIDGDNYFRLPPDWEERTYTTDGLHDACKLLADRCAPGQHWSSTLAAVARYGIQCGIEKLSSEDIRTWTQAI